MKTHIYRNQKKNTSFVLQNPEELKFVNPNMA
jgi:hypothetical protein